MLFHNVPGVEFIHEPIAHTYHLNGLELPSITQLLKHFELTADGFYTQQGAGRGKAVHACLDLFDRGEIDKYEVDAVCLPYLEAYKLFLKETGWKSTLIETPGFNLQHRFAGTPDRRGYFKKPSKKIQRFRLRLKDNGKYSCKEIESDLEADRADFLALVRTFWIQKEKGLSKGYSRDGRENEKQNGKSGNVK